MADKGEQGVGQQGETSAGRQGSQSAGQRSGRLAGRDGGPRGEESAGRRAGRRAELRSLLRRRRAALSEAEQAAASAAVADRLARSDLLAGAGIVAGYLATRGELDIDGALASLVEQGVTVTVPRVVGEDLQFVRWHPTTALSHGAYGIAEPLAGEVIALSRHDVVLAPLVAFDNDGNRLGQGGGYYDRALAAVRGRPDSEAGGDPAEGGDRDGAVAGSDGAAAEGAGRGSLAVEAGPPEDKENRGSHDPDRPSPSPSPSEGPVVIGIAHSFARLDSLPTEPWDQRLDAVITDRQTTGFSRQPRVRQIGPRRR